MYNINMVVQTNSLSNALDSIKNLKEDFVSYMILVFILFVVIIFIVYMINLSRLQKKECNYMENLYGSLNGNLRNLNKDDPNCKENLNDYYIKTAYNCCSGGNYKNDFVDICNLKNVLKQGVRGLDFEIYSIDNRPVVSTSTANSYYIKETYNFLSFSEVMNIITNYAFSSSTSPNYKDPILIHLRIKSNNQKMYANLASIFKSYNRFMLGKEYSFENNGYNIGTEPLIQFMGKIILIVDKSNTAFLENKDFLEYVNMTSNSVFMRSYNYSDIKNNPDINELKEYNKKNMTIVLPDDGVDPSNPSGYVTRELGCQMVAMRFQKVDNFLTEYISYFDDVGYAYSLKPKELRYKPVTIPLPTKQDPNLSYATRETKTDFYSFKY